MGIAIKTGLRVTHHRGRRKLLDIEPAVGRWSAGPTSWPTCRRSSDHRGINRTTIDMASVDGQTDDRMDDAQAIHQTRHRMYTTEFNSRSRAI
jgi:hypothetical protein